jgi:hypothetical protein
MIHEAVPVIQKMIDQYKTQLGERDEVTQTAIRHLAILQSSVPQSHVHFVDASADPAKSGKPKLSKSPSVKKDFKGVNIKTPTNILKSSVMSNKSSPPLRLDDLLAEKPSKDSKGIASRFINFSN